MLSILSKLFTPEQNEHRKTIEKLTSIAGKKGWNAEINNTIADLSNKTFEEQSDFVFAVLEWCKTAKYDLAHDNQNWTVYQVLAKVLEQISNASSKQKRKFVELSTNWVESNSSKQTVEADELYKNLFGGTLITRISTLYKEGETFDFNQDKALDENDFITYISWLLTERSNYWTDLVNITGLLKKYLKKNELSLDLKIKIAELADVVSGNEYKEIRKKAQTLRELARIVNDRVPLVEGETWSDAAIADVSNLEKERQEIWIRLLDECQKSNGARPSARWTKSGKSLIEQIGFDDFKTKILRWFPLVDKPRTKQIETWSEWSPNPNLLLNDVNADVLKGLVWLCAGREDAEIARAVLHLAISAYKKVAQIGPRCVRVGNACVWTLGAMPGAEGVTQLMLLRHKVKGNSVQNLIAAQIQNAAARLNLTAEEVEEMSVPSYGLSEVGCGQIFFGDYSAEIVVTGTNAAEIRWTNADGKAQKSVPKPVKDNHAEELKELNQSVKDIKKMLPAQRDRVENLYLERRSWDFETWRARYLNHPLVGSIARRLIWRFDETTSAVWSDGKLVDNENREMSFFDDSRVELWHPIHSDTAEIIGWRDFLTEKQIRQPFKQAHREIYLLTEAERVTRTYSNRFAAHIIKQHQYNALCAVRGWRNALWIMADMEAPPASRTMTAYNLRAEFWTQPIGENYQTDTTESGTYLYLTTDQVRFYPLSAVPTGENDFQNNLTANIRRQFQPLPLDEIPPLVLSEILRDVDLFVGVGSIGNDPNWNDAGERPRYNEYWQSFSFGELSETAKTRREILSKLIPRLKIAARCELDDKFLYVRGSIRSYKIHLGSGNILMSPNDQYLCIVASTNTENRENRNVFLPFEGDRTLAIILSKAFLLADDAAITDPTIRRQLKL